MNLETETLKMGFRSRCGDQIMKSGGQEMLDELYKDDVATDKLDGFDVTL